MTHLNDGVKANYGRTLRLFIERGPENFRFLVYDHSKKLRVSEASAASEDEAKSEVIIRANDYLKSPESLPVIWEAYHDHIADL